MAGKYQGIEKCNKKFKNISDRIVITTDEGSPLHEFSQEQKLYTLTIPQKVGGRYSVFTPVGLFPLGLLGLNLTELLDAAQDMRDTCITNNYKTNPAILSAAVLFTEYKKRKKIYDTFLFNSELESLGKWYRQLLGESIGKSGKGITPTVSIGTQDLHSVPQLYLGGPKDKYTTFVHVEVTSPASRLSKSPYLPMVKEELSGRRFDEILDAIRDGVKKAYLNEKHPYSEIMLEDISEKSLAEFMQFKMLEVIYLARLMKVNAFDQPQVELYKKETRKILTSFGQALNK